MTTETINQNRTLATVLHLSVFTKYFIPMGNFIFPLLLWLAKKEDPFVDKNGRNAINFQISLFLYTIFLVTVGAALFLFFGIRFSMIEPFFFEHDHFEVHEFSHAIPFIVSAVILGIIFLGLFILEIFAVIMASIRASEGEIYHYPLTINFIGSGESGAN
ncbi:DUF4870 domain-containing protein [Christiangramia fulva]|uniref:DUF4870 domain-containing protein n=1 Tax=Christiangramia fulva TaxID=2126553 RepID=A0A2R3Z774_9FLAO|nr:DUF4870 domain-containing protein [Christiangramia fulva]AVR46084.1 DUF4870 domain-containing protein [Christiangramia fulva]